MKTYPMGTLELRENDRRVVYDVKICPFCGQPLERKYSGAYSLVEADHAPTQCRFSLADLTNKTSRLINFVDADGWDLFFTWDNDGDLWAFLPNEDYDNTIGHALRPANKKLLKEILSYAIDFHRNNLNDCLSASNILDNKED